MQTHQITLEAITAEAIPMMDPQSDRSDINNDGDLMLREAETANFYHDTLNDEE